MKGQKTKKGGMIAAGIFLFLLTALLVFLCVWFFGARYPRFDEAAREEAEVPGVKDGFCPQGLCPLPEGCGYDFAVSGYLGDAPSRVYLVGEKEKYVTLERDGSPLSTHFGGITCTGEYLVVASGEELVRVPLSSVLSAENGAAVPVKDGFRTGLSNAYCLYADGILYAGEFYRAGNYETPESHRFTSGGETNYALVYAFGADESKTGGVIDGTPLFALSVREKVQGIAVYEGGIVLSTSYGLADSQIWFYENIVGGTPSGTVRVGETEVPLYRLDSSCLTDTLTAPCMSEEIFIEDGRLYLLFESRANKYKQFVRRQTDIMSLPVG